MKTYLYLIILVTALFSETRTQVHMGTMVSISLDENQELFGNGFKIIHEVDNALTSYKSCGDIYKLNKNHVVQLDPLTYEALKLSKKYYQQTYGYFDITIGSITKGLYHFGEDEEFIPHPKLLKIAHTGFYNLHFSTSTASTKEGIKVDLGGMGKGFAVQKASEYFLDQGVKSAVIAASGDIRCIGKCEVALQDPFSENTLFIMKTKKDETGITTSGNYRRYVASKKYNHLINPYFKTSNEKFASVTLISDRSSADLDAYATAISVMPSPLAKKFLQSFKIAYIIITVERKMIISKNINEYIEIIQK
ncbi:FAD:protein FMN transferase [Sulfurimonas sp.]|uniref:FAD:protein FMN transferase n=1 Tax=Sulfurimonas sp. TaxID=2022749 RepID=UPI003D10F2AD